MNSETWKAILDTREIEFKHTSETRQMVFDREAIIYKAIFELIHILLKEGIINADDASKVYDALSAKKEGKDNVV